MQVLCRRARCDTEVVTKPVAERVVDEQRLGHVAARGERLHQQPVTALAVRGALDQAPGGALGRLQLAGPDLDTRTADELERPDENLVEPSSLLIDLRRVLSRQEVSGGDVLRHSAGTPGARKIALSGETLGAVQALGRRFQVDPRVSGKRQPWVTAALERHDSAQLREQRAKPVRV